MAYLSRVGVLAATTGLSRMPGNSSGSRNSTNLVIGDLGHILQRCSGAESRLTDSLTHLQWGLSQLWNQANDENILPVQGSVTLLSKKVAKGVKHSNRSQIYKKIIERLDAWREQDPATIPSSDRRRAGKCFFDSYRGWYESGEDKIKYKCFSVFGNVESEKNVVAYTMVCTHNVGDENASEDEIFFHLYDKSGDKSMFFDKEEEIPRAICVNSASPEKAKELQMSSTDSVLKVATNPSLVSMLCLKNFGNETSPKLFTPLAKSSANSLIWVYAVQMEDDTVNFLMCRKELELHKQSTRAWIARGKTKSHGPIQGEAPKVNLWDGKEVYRALVALSMHTERVVATAWKEYVSAKKNYAIRESELSSRNAMMAESVAKLMWEGKEHELAGIREIRETDGKDPFALHWIYHIHTKNHMDEDVGIKFGIRDDFSKSYIAKDKFNARTVAKVALYHCLFFRENYKDRHKGQHSEWSHQAIIDAIDAVKAGDSSDHTFKNGKCVVTVTQKRVEVNPKTCGRLGNLSRGKQFERQEPVALAVRDVCTDKAYNISVQFEESSVQFEESRKVEEFNLLVRMGRTHMPICMEDVRTQVPWGKAKEVKNRAFVQAGEQKLRHAFHHHHVGMQQVVKRVAEIQAGLLKAYYDNVERKSENRKKYGVEEGTKKIDYTDAGVAWCNAGCVHVHQGSSYVWTDVSMGWKIPGIKDVVQMRTRHSLTISHIPLVLEYSGQYAKKGGKNIKYARDAIKEEARNNKKVAKNVSASGTMHAPRSTHPHQFAGDTGQSRRWADMDEESLFSELKMQRAIGAASRIF